MACIYTEKAFHFKILIKCKFLIGTPFDRNQFAVVWVSAFHTDMHRSSFSHCNKWMIYLHVIVVNT